MMPQMPHIAKRWFSELALAAKMQFGDRDGAFVSVRQTVQANEE
jgi:hypothetical protein